MKTYLSVITLYIFLVSLSSFSFGTVIHVPADYSTIQDAIDSSNNGDTILVAKGTYSGTGNKNLNFNGLAITLKAEACPGETIINCGGSGRGFKFESGEGTDSVVDGFTIQNGVSDYGPGIYCDSGSSPTIKNCIIKSCGPGFMQSTRGGGIYCIDGDPEILDCTIMNNGGTWGGGIYLEESDALIRGCAIVNNNTSAFGGTGYGGGIFCKTGAPTIENCDISGNFSGIWSPPLATNGYAGGIWIGANCQAQISNCVLSNNGCVNGGGGIYIASAFPDNPFIINCTIIANYSHLAGSNGGGIYCAGSDPNIQNCILWNNTSQSIQNQIYEDAGSSATVTYCDVWGGYVGVGNINQDPKFVDIDGPDNDASTWDDNDYTLQSNSPCIDTGLSTSASWNDKVGQLRCDYPPAGPGGGVHPYFDMGAYEFPVYFYADVATGSDLNTGLAPDKAKKTIQAAIDASTKGSTVLVAEGVYSGAGNNDLNFNFGAQEAPLRSIKGPEVTVIDCGGTGKGFDLRFEGDRVVIDGFKIVDAGDSGMYIWASDIEVTNCIFIENTGINGGAIEIEQCDPVISNCIITTNTATGNGGGIYSRDDNA
ncbi:MAG TPA: right-handed parallel beta-helix repeat-containing protein, partial [candidate division Zixibacteria bacterium]|nr:right-handed parallel beta-helix repeat-containing protein [candidate division Zixibacteria bacterium]